MKKERILIPAVCALLICSGWAEAQGRTQFRSSGTNLGASHSRASIASPTRAVRPTASRNIGSARQSSNRGGINFNGNQHRGSTPFAGLGQINHGRHDGNALDGLVQQFLGNGYGGGRTFDPYAGEKAHAKAYRDAAIANAVVNVVGILATTHQQRQLVAYAPAPAPQGHIERQRILVHEGRTEEYQVWVPAYTIQSTGELVVGHHETRRRDIAPVYEEREVWIPAP